MSNIGGEVLNYHFLARYMFTTFKYLQLGGVNCDIIYSNQKGSACFDYVSFYFPFLTFLSYIIALLLFYFPFAGPCSSGQGRELLIAGGKEVFSAITKLCTEDKHSTDSQSTAKEFVNAIASLVLFFSFGGFLVHFQTN